MYRKVIIINLFSQKIVRTTFKVVTIHIISTKIIFNYA